MRRNREIFAAGGVNLFDELREVWYNTTDSKMYLKITINILSEDFSLWQT